MNRIFCVIAPRLVLPFLFLGSTNVVADSAETANTFAKAANYVYFSSFEQDPVTKVFSDEQLKILLDNLDDLNLMIREALGIGNSIGGALLSAHFDVKQNVDLLRYHILEPGRTYGWEGTYESDDERYFSDGQYVYHSQYISAIEDLMAAPLNEIITLTDREKDRIQRLANSPENESNYWAIWIGRKFGLF